MAKELTYNQVLGLLANSDSDTFIQQVIVLLILVHETKTINSLKTSDFTFTQYDEGHILISGINEKNSNISNFSADT